MRIDNEEWKNNIDKCSYAVKIVLLLFLFCQIAFKNGISFNVIIIFLLIALVNIYMEKYNSSFYIVLAELILISLGMNFDGHFGILYSMAILDFASTKNIYGMLFTYVLILLLGFKRIPFFHTMDNLSFTLLISFFSLILGYIMNMYREKEKSFRSSLDEERRLRYELENSKAKLLNSAKEVSYLTEVSERNRIAREIHDTAGHSLTGILIQLHAAAKLISKTMDKSTSDENIIKSKAILDKSITALSETITILRDTVYNIKPSNDIGIEYIKNIINNFEFCPVDFSHSGNFNTLKSTQIEVIATNIKEALTNAAKHSNATTVNISLDINELYARLYMKDNGNGCKKIKEGLGISGMRERIENLGGTFSVSSENGFITVCILPIETNKGGGLIENINSRR